jgi:hypothetical protein
VRHEYAIEARVLVGLRKGAHVVGIDRGALGQMRFRYLALLDHADEFDAHVGSLPYVPLRRTIGCESRRVKRLQVEIRLSLRYAEFK